jgi:hypothetical protein
MRRPIISALFILTLLAGVLAQDRQGAEQRAENLRAQLRGVVEKEAELQTRMQQLEEDLKPENIQRSIALIGTTRPEDLRERRRLQLENEKAGVQTQLEQLATSRARLETSIAAAEAEADRQQMQANTPPPPAPTAAKAAAATAAPPSVVPQKRGPKQRVRRHRARKRVRSG